MSTEPRLLHDLLDDAARRDPDTPALGAGDRTASFGELASASSRIARRLRARGLRRGDRVAVRTGDPLAAAAALFAVSRAGAVFSLLHESVRDGAFTHVLDDAEPSVVVCDTDDVRDEAGAAGADFLTTRDLLALADAPAPAAPDGTGEATPPPDRTCPVLEVDPVCMIYTSGTTSRPKAVVSTHQQILFAARAIQKRLGYRSDDTVYCPLPVSFDYGLYQVYLVMLAGARLRFGSPAEAGPPLLRSLIESGATVLAGVPAVSDRLAWLAARGKRRPTSLRLLTNTGAALSEKTVSSLRASLPGLRVQVMYGLTECKRAAIMPPDGDLERPGSCGLPLDGTEIFVIGPDGERLPSGETGQIVVRGPNVMAGYWRREELTAERFHRRDGLFPELRTGDYGWVDEDGYLYFDGRRDDIYKERGFRVSATEVEAAAHRVEGVDSAIVLPPADGRPAQLAVISSIPKEEVLERMRQEIEEFKVPRICVRLDDLPTNGNGKIDRARLADLISASGRA
ncbi:acyl--CoA ligase [Nocardiopsis sp. EMB25]|uniref:class I adenylate-forming enzyme family protein n=1 Tax=Nocardiopsis sp. EMB25 TaxID=2835867 RepID=UPI002283CC45|nr:class I adenylate-forming enzyme family protein [Nocardiopsis sp. EMB25]MCY9787250.1 acyl--CoA ligase [Nocardiopsis sp. EMB25]